MTFLFKEETYKIIGVCMDVHRELGSGFLEAVYQEALEIEFQNQNIPFKRERQLDIYYKGIVLKKKYYTDFFCYNKIVLELKALCSLNTDHQSQLLNALKSTKSKVGLLVNFGESKLKYKRMVI